MRYYNTKRKNMKITRGTSFKSFVEKAKQTHGETYTYSEESYHSLPKDILITCPIHGEFKQRANRHIAGSGCSICTHKKGSDNRRATTEQFIQRMIKKWGNIFTYDRSTYTTITSPIIITCPTHGDFQVLPVNAFKGKWHRCLECRKNEVKKYDAEQFIAMCKVAHSNKYTYEKTTLQFILDKIIVTCPIHGDFVTRASHHLHSKSGCRKCNAARRTLDDFLVSANKIHDNRYTYNKTEYTRNHDLGIFTCHKHGDFKQTFMSHLSGKGCPRCKVIESIPQKGIATYIKSIYTGMVDTNVRLINNKEIDIYLPDKKIAIELDGVFWHSTGCPNYQKLPVERRRNTALKNQTFKHVAMAEKGIRLITILDAEWERNTEAVKNILHHTFHTLPKVGARECVLKSINYCDCKEFMNTYHIQGNTPAKYYYGLYHNEELISVMSFRLNKGEWELARYCSTKSVQGGASKLLSAFVKEHSPAKIISFCHDRLFSGEVYAALGFTKEKSYPFDYYFFFKGKLFTRRHFTKQKIPKEFHLKGYFETTENYGAYTLFVPGGTKFIKHYPTVSSA